jgi:hypothetical protein
VGSGVSRGRSPARACIATAAAGLEQVGVSGCGSPTP